MTAVRTPEGFTLDLHPRAELQAVQLLGPEGARKFKSIASAALNVGRVAAGSSYEFESDTPNGSFVLTVIPSAKKSGKIVAIALPKTESEVYAGAAPPSADQSRGRALALNATVTWSTSISRIAGSPPALVPPPAIARGIYIVEKQHLLTEIRSTGPTPLTSIGGVNYRPIYVGISTNFSDRWTNRLALVNELDLSQAIGAELGKYRVRFGSVATSDLNAVEWTIIRTIYRKFPSYARQHLTNRSEIRPFRVDMGGLNLQHSGALPAYLEQAIGATDQWFEF